MEGNRNLFVLRYSGLCPMDDSDGNHLRLFAVSVSTAGFVFTGLEDGSTKSGDRCGEYKGMGQGPI